jgi:hypothetical protein
VDFWQRLADEAHEQVFIRDMTTAMILLTKISAVSQRLIRIGMKSILGAFPLVATLGLELGILGENLRLCRGGGDSNAREIRPLPPSLRVKSRDQLLC